MDRTVKLKLNLSDESKETLRQTMILGNRVFNEIARYGFENHTCSKVSVHHATYYCIREKHPELPCSILQGIRDVACEALKGLELKKLPVSKPFSAIRYNKRVHRINLLKQNVSLSSIKGRVNATFLIPEYYRQYLNWEFKTSTLSYNKQQDTFYLHVVIHKLSPEPVGDKVLGIDRGIVNIAVTSNNRFFNSKPIRKISGKEQRFVSEVNHCISKGIVAMPFDIFAELDQFLRYKAEAMGRSVVTIDPRYTSQKCFVCGHIHKGNRKGHSFKCLKCGFQIHADLNAARNIAVLGISGNGRLSVTQPYIACDEVESRKGIDTEHSDNAPHFKSAE